MHTSIMPKDSGKLDDIMLIMTSAAMQNDLSSKYLCLVVKGRKAFMSVYQFSLFPFIPYLVLNATLHYTTLYGTE